MLITTDAVGGVWRYSLTLARGLSEQGERSTLAVLGPAPEEAGHAEAARIPGCTLLCTGLPLEWTLTDGSAINTIIRSLIGIATNSRAATAHLHAPALAARPWPIPTVAVAHSCMATWWDMVRGTERPPEIEWHARATADGLNTATAALAPSRAFAELLATTYQPQRPIHVIHNGLPFSSPVHAQRAQHVLCAGRLWDISKNIGLLDRAAAHLAFPIHAAGPLAAPGQAVASFDNLRLVGNLPESDLQLALSQAAIFASPAFYEPFGLAVLEAAQCATPLVLADIPTFRELWDDAAIFLRPDDEAAWVHALTMLMDDGLRRDRLGQAALNRAQTFTHGKMVEAIIALHRKLHPPALRAA